jgi:hypothetical protein
MQRMHLCSAQQQGRHVGQHALHAKTPNNTINLMCDKPSKQELWRWPAALVTSHNSVKLCSNLVNHWSKQQVKASQSWRWRLLGTQRPPNNTKHQQFKGCTRWLCFFDQLIEALTTGPNSLLYYHR